MISEPSLSALERFPFSILFVTKESTWNPNARNGQYYGLYQTNTDNLARYGCSGALLSDPVCQLQAADKYKSRYGSWADAYNSWRAQGWW
jgi:hypothetical protein